MKYSNFKIKAENDAYLFASVDCTEELGFWPFNKFATKTVDLYYLKNSSLHFNFLSSGEKAPCEITKLWEAEQAKAAYEELK
jgi:hypothetical protein